MWCSAIYIKILADSIRSPLCRKINDQGNKKEKFFGGSSGPVLVSLDIKTLLDNDAYCVVGL